MSSLIPLIWFDPRHHLPCKAFTRSTPVITWPIKQPWLLLLEAAHCHLKAFKEQSRFQPSCRDLNYVSMCGRYGGLTSKWSVSVAEAGLAIVWLSFPPRLTRGDLTGYTVTAHAAEHPFRHKQGDISREATSDCNLWTIIMVSECSRKGER